LQDIHDLLVKTQIRTQQDAGTAPVSPAEFGNDLRNVGPDVIACQKKIGEHFHLARALPDARVDGLRDGWRINLKVRAENTARSRLFTERARYAAHRSSKTEKTASVTDEHDHFFIFYQMVK
jgi:hypothetical protein